MFSSQFRKKTHVEKITAEEERLGDTCTKLPRDPDHSWGARKRRRRRRRMRRRRTRKRRKRRRRRRRK